MKLVKNAFALCILLIVSGNALAQDFDAKHLVGQMDRYNLLIPNDRSYIQHCGLSVLAGGNEACTVHGTGPYFFGYS